MAFSIRIQISGMTTPLSVKCAVVLDSRRKIKCLLIYRSLSSPFTTQPQSVKHLISPHEWNTGKSSAVTSFVCNSSGSSNQMFLFCYCCCCYCRHNRVWTCSWMSIKLHKGTHRHKHNSDSCYDSYFPSWKIDYNKSFAQQEWWWCFLANLYRRRCLLCFARTQNEIRLRFEQGMCCVPTHQFIKHALACSLALAHTQHDNLLRLSNWLITLHTWVP